WYELGEYISEQQEDQCEHLKRRLHFAEVGCSADKSLLDLQQSQSRDRKFPCDDDNCNPGRYSMPFHQDDQTCRDQQLVGQRVQEFPHVCNQIPFAREVTIKKICKCCNNKNNR